MTLIQNRLCFHVVLLVGYIWFHWIYHFIEEERCPLQELYIWHSVKDIVLEEGGGDHRKLVQMLSLSLYWTIW